jgi:hypothetical protein
MLNRIATWFSRIMLLFGAVFLLYYGYLQGLVRHDTLQMESLLVYALSFTIMFLFTFPIRRIDSRLDRLKKLSERLDSSKTVKVASLNKRYVRRVLIALMLSVILVIANFVLAEVARLNANHPKMLFHLAGIVATVLIFETFMLTSAVDNRFAQLEELISGGKPGKPGKPGEN